MKNKLIATISVTAVIFAAIAIVIFAAPGTNEDPIVSLSFVEQRLLQLKTELTGEINKLDPNMQRAMMTFKVVEVKKGQKLVCGEGTEMILRQGKAEIFATKKGGLANTTTGWDLGDGTAAPFNSLLICPLADGRGLKAQEDLLVMVKGTYTLQ